MTARSVPPSGAGAPDVAILGAGFAGLAAATALAEAGARVVVVEARPGLGGRASAFRDPATGEIVDNGQHVLVGCYRETLAFLDRIGASDRLRRQSSLSVPMIDERGHETRLGLPALPPPWHLLGGVFAWDALSWADRLSVLRLGPALQAGPSGARPDETVRDWLTRHGQAERLCTLLWEPLALAALNQPIDRAAAVHFVTVLAEMFGPDPDAAALLLPAVPLDELYAEPARAWLHARGSEVRTGAAGRILVEDGRAAGVRVRGEVIRAGAVIATAPWHAVGALFDEVPPSLQQLVDDAHALDSSPIVTVNLWYDRPVMEGPLVGLPGRTFQWVFDKRELFGMRASHLSLVSSGAETVVSQDAATLTAAARAEVEAALPAARRATLRKALAVRERRATFSLAPGGPPRPGVCTELPGLLLAGDWIATGLPATIESATAAGHAAARVV